jgi:flagellar motor protein MotB
MQTRIEKQPVFRGFIRRGGCRAVPVAILGSLLLVGGCSYVPDALNPAEWYKSTVDVFTGNGQTAQNQPNAGKENAGKENALVAERGKPPPGANKPFPKLSTVPARPVKGLAGDTRNRRYAKAVPRQGEAVSRLQPETKIAKATPAAAVGALRPPPPAMPVKAVTPAPAPTPPPAAAQAPVPPSAVAQASIPPRPNELRKTFESDLAQRLPTGGPGKTPAQGMMSIPAANTLPTFAPDRFATVIISAQGVELTAPPTAVAAVKYGGRLPPPSGGLTSRSTAEISRAQGGVLKVATIMFANGSARLTARDIGILRQVELLAKQRGGTLRVIGYASGRTRNMDPISHKMVNFQISVKRANAVARELVRLGVHGGKIQVDARSDDNPLYYEFMPSGEAGNRRAEIYIVS